MHLVYIDESARDDRFYFFGALIADARAIRLIEDGMNGVGTLLARNVSSFDPHSEFHAVDIVHGKGAWAAVPTAWRIEACDLVAKILARSSAKFLFRGIDLAAQRVRYSRPFPAHLLALAHTLEDIHMRLDRLEEGDMGLVLADQHHAAANARRSLRNFKLAAVPGYTSRRLARIANTIYFGPSHESRLLQAADVATYFLNRHLTVDEKDARAAKAVQKIVSNVRAITVSEYVWSPDAKHNAPRQRGVGRVREA
ncbi:DUF3800 domain-containing protein [Leifsonia sp. 2MCAF36]|uniref:DUF3800 domain-containing protein n=1 Tax=Leifsonia sp. 2MCAF36 TaxID=3232988 RepID=UPI003F9BFA2E